MRLSRLKVLSGFFLAMILCASAWGANSPEPGTLNYIEGQARIGSTALNSKSVGSAELQPGQSLRTGNGRTEILLTPGVFLRVGENSSVKMISSDLANTQVALNSGHAMVEVDEIHKANDISVLQDGATVQLKKTGLYDFDAPHDQVRVFKGQAIVHEGDRKVKLGGGRQLTLNMGGKLKAQKFDKKADEANALYRFGQLRSDYLAEANANAAQVYVANGGFGPDWYGPGWFWDPWYSAYTFIPAGGIFYSPFGFPFYSSVIVHNYPYAFVGPHYGYVPYGRAGVIGGHGFRGRVVGGGFGHPTGGMRVGGFGRTGGGFARAGGGFAHAGGGFAHAGFGGGFHR